MDFILFVNGESDNIPKFVEIVDNKVELGPKKGDQGNYLVSVIFETKASYLGDKLGLKVTTNVIIQQGNNTEIEAIIGI